MPLIYSPRKRIAVDVADKQIDDTLIKQRAVSAGFWVEQAENGQVSVVITVVLQAFSAVAGGYGLYLGHRGVPDRLIELSARNDTLVDGATGEILAQQGTTSDADWIAQAQADERAVMLQGDFFEYLRENQPVLIGDMIRHHIQQADAAGRFA